MRPSRKQLWDRTMAGMSVGVLAATGLFWASDARADTVSMKGVLGYQPDYANLGLCPCKPLSHPVMPWSVPTITDRIEQWVETPDSVNPSSPKVALTYSLSTVGALEYLDQPGAKPVQVWAFGSPETPKRDSRAKVAPESRESVHFVVALYDPIADPMRRWNLYAAINSRLSTHLHGYDDLDLSNPSATYTAPDGSTTLYYAPEVLPMLKWLDGRVTEERMAELDAKYRARIEAAYDRPVKVPAPSQVEANLSEIPNSSMETNDVDQRNRLRADDANNADPALPENPENGGDMDVDPVADERQTSPGVHQRETSLDESLTWSNEDDTEPDSQDESLSETSKRESTQSAQSVGQQAENTSTPSSRENSPDGADASDAPSDDSDDNEGGDE